MRRLTSLVSFWSLIAFGALLALQAFPLTGVFLMMLGAAMIAGLLVHVFLISLLVEAIGRRVPRALMVLPIAAYAGYYALYAGQAFEVAQASAELKAQNPGKILAFDPLVYSLVTPQARELVERYEIPVAYEANANFKPEGYLSYRLLTRDQCDVRRDSQGRIRTFGVSFNRQPQMQLCQLQFPEAPGHQLVTVDTRSRKEDWAQISGVNTKVTEISIDGNVIGSFKTASFQRLPMLPGVFIGCALISSTPAWKCGAGFMKSHADIDAIPEGVDRARHDSPVSVMLGLKKYSAWDMVNFRGFEEGRSALARIAEDPPRVENAVFEVLGAILAGEAPKLPRNMGYSIAQNPARLAPLGDAIFKRFAELNQPDPTAPRDHEELARVLAAGIAALPRDAFLRVSDQVFSIIQKTGGSERYPVLYIRAADAGVATLEFYKQEFLAARIKPYLRMLPVLAICRIGQADEQTIAEMKRRLVAGKAPKDNDYKTALFVALLKLGEEAFLREQFDSMPQNAQDWMTAVLANRAATETGPNNCMAQRWPSTVYLGPVMQPDLQWTRRAWTMRDQ